MTQPTAYTGRPLTPAPGVEAKEYRIARVRAHGRRMLWPALVLVAVAAAAGYFAGNLPEPVESWVPEGIRAWIVWPVAGVVVLLLVVAPYVRWLMRTYTVTTRRVVAESGLFSRTRAEISHARGYTIGERRGPVQRLWGSGTLTLTNGVDAPMRLVDIPSVRLMHETLADQVEVSQILAHRDSQAVPFAPGPPPPLPPRP
ncbi:MULTISPECIES: PH domain-containing protein [unclassified Microbacterium]|uniref:PH domain-containing protein n=1 Tax=unclassified Microbacterium TaxID=2609290 RepID=UPI003018412B